MASFRDIFTVLRSSACGRHRCSSFDTTYGEDAGLRDGDSEIGNWAGERRTTAPPGRCGRRRNYGRRNILGVQDSSPDENATSNGPGQPATTSRAAADDSPTWYRLPDGTLTSSARRRPSLQMVDTWTVTLFNVREMTGPRVNADAQTKVRDERPRSSRRLPKWNTGKLPPHLINEVHNRLTKPRLSSINTTRRVSPSILQQDFARLYSNVTFRKSMEYLQ